MPLMIDNVLGNITTLNRLFITRFCCSVVEGERVECVLPLFHLICLSLVGDEHGLKIPGPAFDLGVQMTADADAAAAGLPVAERGARVDVCGALASLTRILNSEPCVLLPVCLQRRR
jgi:hypothetical protein